MFLVGTRDQVYVCLEPGGVVLSKKLLKGLDYKTQECGRIEEMEIVTVTAQAIIFERGGSVARMHKQGILGDDGWFSYNHHGLTGKRHFSLLTMDVALGELIGNLHVSFRRSQEQVLANVLKINCDPRFLIKEIGEYADDDEKAQQIYVQVRVNREKQRTKHEGFLEDTEDSKGATVDMKTPLANWNQGVGQGLLFDATGSDGEAVIEAIVLSVYKVGDDNDELIGKCMLDLGDRIIQEEWNWDCSGRNPLEIRKDVKIAELEKAQVYRWLRITRPKRI